MIHITDTTVFDESEIQERVVRAAGSVNEAVREARAAIELRLDLEQSSLPPDVKRRLIAVGRKHLTADGSFVVVSRSHGSRVTNRDAALAQLLRFLIRASVAPPGVGRVLSSDTEEPHLDRKVPTGMNNPRLRVGAFSGEDRPGHDKAEYKNGMLRDCVHCGDRGEERRSQSGVMGSIATWPAAGVSRCVVP